MSEADAAAERIQQFRTARGHWIDEPSEVPIRSYTLPCPLGEKSVRVYLTDADLGELLVGYALLAARVAELETERPTDGEEARYTEWATRTPDGTRTRWTFEPYAREAMQINPHLKLDSREIRHFVGNWRPADASTSDTSSSGTVA